VRLDDDDHWAYSLCIFEGYSRKILAGMATAYQDTVAVLQLLSAALAEYGKPEGLVSDNGSVSCAGCLVHPCGVTLCFAARMN
jgi:hypothetical protein